jgi:DNA-directed RNA polymerase subunit RPC12/RpoP
MKIIALKCPNCNADIELDQDREFGFCNYCGTKIMIADAVQKVSGTVNINRSSEINNILKRAKDYEERQMLDEAEKYYDRALDIDMDNQEAQEGLERVKTTILEPNVIIERPELEGSYAEQIVVSEDGEEVCRLGLGERSFIECPVGRHVFDIRTRNEAIKARITIKDRRDSAKISLWFQRGYGLYGNAEGSAKIVTKGANAVPAETKSVNINDTPTGGGGFNVYLGGKPKKSGCLTKILIAFGILLLLGIIGSLR